MRATLDTNLQHLTLIQNYYVITFPTYHCLCFLQNLQTPSFVNIIFLC